MENQAFPPSEVRGEDFAQLLESFQGKVGRFAKDQLVSGRIVRITDREIYIELGAKSEGVVQSKDIEALPKDVRNSLKEGDEVFAYVLQPEDANGNVVLSLSRAVSEKDWRTAEDLFARQEAFEVTIAGFNKGGVIAKIGRLRGFLPASHLSAEHQRMIGSEDQPPEQRFQKLIGQKTLVKVIEVDRKRNRLILSERAASKEARALQKERLLSTIEVGQVLQGMVTSVREFGAFVDLGGADGMIHLSELSHGRVKHPSEVLKEGQQVTVKVISLDRESGRIGLSLKALEPDPWQDITKRYRVGQLVEAEVFRVHQKHGAFVRLKGDESIEALVPLSELSDKPISSPREVIKEGQIVTLRVLRIEPEQRRMALSLRRVNRAEFADLDWKLERSVLQALQPKGTEPPPAEPAESAEPGDRAPSMDVAVDAPPAEGEDES
ncbi:MAG: S1 RNA-binding domain-containing protein [Anaerolineae bacterium]|nr:S1 RNA-binding domain-containing protein [Anaerolineae bacterium]MDW8293083.1 S1 RNA-binding domain-containing protein [Anaerolineae bacterium]